MRSRRPLGFLELCGSLLLVVLAPLGFVLLTAAGLLGRRLAPWRSWGALWLGAALPALLALPLLPRGAALFLLSSLTLGFVASLLLNAPRRSVVAGFSAALGLLALASAVDLALGAVTWQAFDGRSNLPKLLSPRAETVEVPSSRRWTLPEGTSAVALSFEARHLSGPQGWNWHRSLPSFVLQPLAGEAGVGSYVRVWTPLGDDPWLMRSYDNGRPIGGETFRATVSLRAAEPFPTESTERTPERTPGVWLQAQGPEGLVRSVLPVVLEEDWQTFELLWTPPEDAETTVIHLVLNDFDGLSYDIGEAVLERYRDGAWEGLALPSPVGAALGLDWPARPPDRAASLRFMPGEAWQGYRLEVANASLEAGGVLHAGLQPEAGTALELRGLQLEASGPGSPRSRPSLHRLELWFEQPNLLGHTAAVVGLVALALQRRVLPAALVFGLAVFTVALTGGRAAWFGLLLGAALLLLHLLVSRGLKRRHLTLALAGFLVLAGAVGVLGLERLQGFGVEEVTGRPEIWRAAWQAFVEHPWRGIGHEGFAAYWQEHAQRQSLERVQHAHNFWLAFASSYGLLGLTAALWLSGGLLLLAWRWGRVRGLALAVPVLGMNLVDFTLFHNGVLFALLLGLNALRSTIKEHYGERQSAFAPRGETGYDT